MNKTVFVESLALSGCGVATIDEDGYKRAVFIPFSCPGDKLLVSVNERFKKYYRAEIIEILEPSSLRQEPRCKHYQSCGGCDLLHINYGAQLDYKRKIIEFMFKDLYSGDVKVVSGESDNYRHKMRIIAENGVAGYRKAKSDAIECIDECRIVTKGILGEIKAHRGKTGEFFVITSNEGVSSWPANFKVSKPLLSYTCLGKEIKFSPTSFIQSNTLLNEKLVKKVVDIVNLKKPKSILELFSGIGNFTAHLSGDITAVEGDKEGSSCAMINAPHAKNINSDVYDFIENDNSKYDLILLDPPRAGLKEGTISLLSKKTKTLLYVSCNPKALKNDIKKVKGKIRDLILVDLFPHTAHIELVAVISID